MAGGKWRISFFNPLTGNHFDWDAPAETIRVNHKMSHSTTIETVLPVTYPNKDLSGNTAIQALQTLVVARDPEGHEYAGIVTDDPHGEKLKVVAHGCSALLKNMPWQGPQRSWTGVKASTVFQVVWDNITKRTRVPRMRLRGIENITGILGTPPTKAWREHKKLHDHAKLFVTRKENRVDYWERRVNQRAAELAKTLGPPRKAGQVVVQTTAPERKDAATNKIVIYRPNNESTPTWVYWWVWTGTGTGTWKRRHLDNTLLAARRYLRDLDELNAVKAIYPGYVTRMNEEAEWLKDNEHQAGEPYRLNEWANRDLAQTLKELCDASGTVWYDTIEWDEEYGVKFPVPTIVIDGTGGRKRRDLKLELGVNVVAYPELTRRVDDMATHVSVIGAGEGSTTLIATRSHVTGGMVERWKTVSDKGLDTRQLVNNEADKQLRLARQAGLKRYERIEIINHHLAPVGTITPGDWVYPIGRDKAGDRIDRWVQVTGIERSSGTNRVTLFLEGN